jgi:hypothetical protein
MLASYTDGRALEFWEEYLKPGGQAGGTGENAVGANRWQEHAMSEATLDEVQRQMQVSSRAD